MTAASHLTRRDIVRQFALGWAVSQISGAATPQRVLAASAPSIESTGTLVLSISEFPVLGTNLGSLSWTPVWIHPS
jgi:hypothetical protein